MGIAVDLILRVNQRIKTYLCLDFRPTVALHNTLYMASNETQKVSIGEAQSLTHREH